MWSQSFPIASGRICKLARFFKQKLLTLCPLCHALNFSIVEPCSSIPDRCQSYSFPNVAGILAINRFIPRFDLIHNPFPRKPLIYTSCSKQRNRLKLPKSFASAKNSHQIRVSSPCPVGRTLTGFSRSEDYSSGMAAVSRQPAMPVPAKTA